MDLRKELVKMINENGLKGKVRANKSGCLDICEEGPALVIYPKGFWYSGVKKEDLNNIFNKSIVKDDPVTELIMSPQKIKVK
jgi:(2Fe-2S) ferredoxin